MRPKGEPRLPPRRQGVATPSALARPRQNLLNPLSNLLLNPLRDSATQGTEGGVALTAGQKAGTAGNDGVQ